ncbi:uncharacterized protein SCDLUD_000567 [Saccharomycodes ludwigii]|uniref:uncharacterized protein n=1 Tax=Saccharomycodes ludwigii TaxID=36035 RepID=UPI001E87BFED|nr:hypothetical protein SCDLUD_000567 [Saccharomycodes ludwigii]KAH3902967.1 hypothetical protein SCDLUD_000567 [Saccharomycodes ludwigii]
MSTTANTNNNNKYINDSLAVQYRHRPAKKLDINPSQGLLTNSLPMAAMFMRNKFLAWFSLFTTWHYFLTTPSISTKDTKNPQDATSFKLVASIVSIVVCYMDMLFIPKGSGNAKQPDVAVGSK